MKVLNVMNVSLEKMELELYKSFNEWFGQLWKDKYECWNVFIRIQQNCYKLKGGLDFEIRMEVPKYQILNEDEYSFGIETCYKWNG